MIEFDLINPSDPYTFLADDLETAALTVMLLSPAYAAESKDGQKVPVFLFGGFEEWYIETFNREAKDGLSSKKDLVANALESMMYGSYEDRRRYTAALEAITEEDKREKFIAMWQDSHSSLNDIGTYAHELAKRLREKTH